MNFIENSKATFPKKEKSYIFLFCLQKHSGKQDKIFTWRCLIKKRVTLHLNKIF